MITFLKPALILAVTVSFECICYSADPEEKKPDNAVGLEKATKLKPIDFATKADRSSVEVVRLSELALKKSAHPPVRSLAAAMVTNHQQIRLRLTDIIEMKKYPTENWATNPTNHLTSASKEHRGGGANFDSSFVTNVINIYSDLIVLYTTASQELEDDELKALAVTALPVFLENLTSAHKLKDDLPKP